jgi:hypothetical protein
MIIFKHFQVQDATVTRRNEELTTHSDIPVVFQNRVLRRISWPKKGEVIARRKVLNEDQVR